MHVQTHILSGWCAGNLFRFTPRERLCCMIAAGAPDLDGLGIVFGEEAYWDYHHVVGHNLLAALLIAAVLAAFSSRKVVAFGVYVALVHLHLLMDLYGSGPGWGIPYLWPFAGHVTHARHGWAFYSWQNISAAGVMVAWTLAIVATRGRTPLEAIMPALDRQLVALWQRRFPPRPRPATDG